MKFKKRIKRKFKKWDFKWIITTIIAIIALCFTVTNQSYIMNLFGTIKIDFSRIMPYEFSGFYTNYKDIFIKSQDMMGYTDSIYNKACAIRTYFKNTMADVYRISDIFINVKEISPIVESHIDITADVIDNCIHVYAINQGLGNANNIQVALNLESLENDIINMDAYFNFDGASSTVVIDDIYGGEIIELFSIDIKQEFIDFILQNNNWLNLGVELFYENESKKFLLGALYYNEFEQVINITKAQGQDMISTTYFCFINVNNGEGKYSIGMPINPNIENGYNVGVDTIIIPDQSCELLFSISYKIANKIIETEDFYAQIMVPLYNDDFGFYDSLLGFCIENQIKDYKNDTVYSVENVLKYNVYSILDSFEIKQ